MMKNPNLAKAIRIPILQKGYDSLGVRFVDCPHCQKQHDRDTNAAINIRNEGLRLWSQLLHLGSPQVE